MSSDRHAWVVKHHSSSPPHTACSMVGGVGFLQNPIPPFGRLPPFGRPLSLSHAHLRWMQWIDAPWRILAMRVCFKASSTWYMTRYPAGTPPPLQIEHVRNTLATPPAALQVGHRRSWRPHAWYMMTPCPLMRVHASYTSTHDDTSSQDPGGQRTAHDYSTNPPYTHTHAHPHT